MTTDYEKLAAPFARTFKKPPHNLEYITGEQVVSRLNEELGFDGWTFLVREHGENEESDSVWVLGELTVIREDRVITKQQFGSQEHNRTKDSKKIIDYGFDLKGAATDALKKCATLIGVGLYLSEKEGGQAPAQPQRPAPTPTSKPKTTTFMDWAAGMGYDADFVHTVSKWLFGPSIAPNKLTLEDKKKLAVALEEEKKAVSRA